MGSGDVHRAMLYANKVINPAHTLNGQKATKTLPHIDGLKSAFGAAKGAGFKPSIEILEHVGLQLKNTGATSVETLVGAMKKAKNDLLKYINEANPGNRALKALLIKHPALRVISDEFWFSAAIVWWGLGWDNSSHQRQGNTASVIMGWGLLYNAYNDIVLTPLSYHRRAWPLIRAAETTCRMMSVVPWWAGLLEADVLRAERIQLLGDLADGEDWEDDEESVDGSGNSKDSYITWLEPTDHVRLPGAREGKGDPEVDGNEVENEAPELDEEDGALNAEDIEETELARPNSQTETREGAGNAVKSRELLTDTDSSDEDPPAKASKPTDVDAVHRVASSANSAQAPGSALLRGDSVTLDLEGTSSARRQHVSQPVPGESIRVN